MEKEPQTGKITHENPGDLQFVIMTPPQVKPQAYITVSQACGITFLLFLLACWIVLRYDGADEGHRRRFARGR